MKNRKWILGAAVTGAAVCLALAFNSCAFSGLLETGAGESTATATVQTIEPAVTETVPAATAYPTSTVEKIEIPCDDAISKEQAIENAIDGMVEHGELADCKFEDMYIITRYVSNPPYDDCPLWVVVFSKYSEMVDGDRNGNVTARYPGVSNYYVKLNALTGDYIYHFYDWYGIDLSSTVNTDWIIDSRSYLYD